MAPNEGASIFMVHLPARYAHTRFAPSPCFSLRQSPSLLPHRYRNAKTGYSPARFVVREMFEVYDPPIRQAQEIHEQC